ncbi:hypothetical protein GCM10022222_07230 [Amycolatopsis ultiminotia]|uniref:HTH tetR-type domain-containing protein n=1 Tax=Amycolatopsis ultiminotia TaxID=543629 RepID=A0ABP6V126_9PSEU
MSRSARDDVREAMTEIKRASVLDAALRVFATKGLRGASMRAIAQEAGYVAGALYAYFPSKEHIYAAALEKSLDRLGQEIRGAAEAGASSRDRLRRAGLAYFDFYDKNPRDMDMGFYLFGGGIEPRGLSDELDRALNRKLLDALAPIAESVTALGAPAEEADRVVAGIFACASGILLLAHTRRLALFGADARQLMLHQLDLLIESVPQR